MVSASSYSGIGHLRPPCPRGADAAPPQPTPRLVMYRTPGGPMKRLLWAALIAALALSGCDKKKGPNPPSPTTSQVNEQMRAVAAATPASDPSLPSATTAMAALDATEGTTTR